MNVKKEIGKKDVLIVERMVTSAKHVLTNQNVDLLLDHP